MNSIQQKKNEKENIINKEEKHNDWIKFLTNTAKNGFKLVVMVLIASNILFSSKFFTNNDNLPTDSNKYPYKVTLDSEFNFPYQYKVLNPSNNGEKILNWLIYTIESSWIGSRTIIKQVLMIFKGYLNMFMNINTSSNTIQKGISNIVNYVIILISTHLILPLFLFLSMIGGGLGLIIGGISKPEGIIHKLLALITSIYMTPILIIQALYTLVMLTIQPLITNYKYFIDYFKKYSGFITFLFVLYLLSDAYTYLDTPTFTGIVIGIVIMYIGYFIKLIM